jgi:hypothetical protein
MKYVNVAISLLILGCLLGSCSMMNDPPPSNPESCGYYIYYNVNGEVTITGLSIEWYDSTNADKYDFFLPDEIKGMPVTTIGCRAFDDESSITSVVIPASVISIDMEAFGGCRGLTSVSIGTSVTVIGLGAFASCNLLSVDIPDSVTTIEDYAFAFCANLISATFGRSVSILGETPFFCCENLCSIDVDQDNPLYCSAQGVLFSKDQSTLFYYPEGKDDIGYVLPDAVITVADYAFLSCKNLTSLILGNSVRTIGDRAFYGCENMNSINFPDSLTSIGYSAFFGCSSLTSVDLSYSITTIGEEAFGECSSMETVALSNSLTALRDGTFVYCQSLTSIIIPDSVTSIGEYVFGNCENLASVILGKSLKTIGRAAFMECDSLTSVFIPDSVIAIGDEAFCDCSGLTSIDVDADNSVYCSIDGVLFSKDQSILIRYPAGKADDSYIIPNSVYKITESAFCDCENIFTLCFGSAVGLIERKAFQGCCNVVEIELPNTVTGIGSDAFSFCENLLSVYIDAITPPEVGAGVFFRNADKRKIYVPAASVDAYRIADGWSAYAGDIESQ